METSFQLSMAIILKQHSSLTNIIFEKNKQSNWTILMKMRSLFL